jgi:hypothetical protein
MWSNDIQRSKAGSMVLENPSGTTTSAATARTDGGNVQLMDARLTELYSSLRALKRSNEDLKEALLSDPGDKDFIEAIEENWNVMRNQRTLAMELVSDMKARGVAIDLPKDICDMEVPAWKKKTEQNYSSGTETGAYL